MEIDAGRQEAAVATLEAQRAARESDLGYWKQQTARLETLLKAGAVSQQEYDQAVSTVRIQRGADGGHRSADSRAARRTGLSPRDRAGGRAWSATSRCGSATGSPTRPSSPPSTTTRDSRSTCRCRCSRRRACRSGCRCASSTIAAIEIVTTAISFVAPVGRSADAIGARQGRPRPAGHVPHRSIRAGPRRLALGAGADDPPGVGHPDQRPLLRVRRRGRRGRRHRGPPAAD